MSFPVMNAKVVTTMLTNGRSLGGSVNKAELLSLSYPLFEVSGVVDVSGMEMAIATQLVSATTSVQTLASGTTTVVFKPHDGGTNGGSATDNNEFFAVTDFSNSAIVKNNYLIRFFNRAQAMSYNKGSSALNKHLQGLLDIHL